MTRITATAAALMIAALAMPTVNARAQDLNPNEKTYLTFSAPVELPGMTLPAGTYTFRLADSPQRNVVQVLSRDEQKIFGQFLFAQATRTQTSDDPVVMFKESAAGATPAIQYWYYPTELIGKEFIYPKDQALKIAQRTKTSVLTSDGERVGDADHQAHTTSTDGNVTRQPAPESTQARAETAPPPQPAPAPAYQAPPAPAYQAPAANPTPAQTPRDSSSTVGDSLPQTASPLPLVALAGMLSLIGGLGVRMFRS